MYIFLRVFAIKIKGYLHVSYLQLFDYLHIHNIHNVVKYTVNENLKTQYFSQHNTLLITFFATSSFKEVIYGQKTVKKLQ